MGTSKDGRKRLAHLRSPAFLMALVALVFSVTGAAIAVQTAKKNSVVSKSIKNGAVKSADLKDNGVATGDLAGGAVTGAKLADGAVGTGKLGDGAVNSAKIADGSVAAGDLAAGVAGARAYGHVSQTGELSRSKNATARREQNGIYCITPGAGIDPATAVVIVSAESSQDNTDTGNVSHTPVQWQSQAPSCDAGELEVNTFIYDGDATDDAAGGDELDVEDSSFAFVIP